MTPKQIDSAIAEVTGKSLPYSSCLNAMHEAEKVLTPEQQCTYMDELFHAANGSRNFVGFHKKQVMATAAQRAEAFLRTLGLWKPTALTEEQSKAEAFIHGSPIPITPEAPSHG